MENYRHIKLLIKFVFKSAAAALLLWPFFVFAYSTVTHEALTKETIDFFNSNFSYPDFNEEEKTALEKGSIDEDDGSLEPSIYLKRMLPRAGLEVFPMSGHCLNLEEPERFNRALLDFLTAVDTGTWPRRDARAAPKSG